jgi:hypothetical protein
MSRSGPKTGRNAYPRAQRDNRDNRGQMSRRAPPGLGQDSGTKKRDIHPFL